MQTFLPYPNFYETSRVLDRQCLGKQRVETKQILQVLLGESSGNGWAAHPATLMWYGFEGQLTIYGLYICSEWRYRGYQDTLFPWFEEKRKELVGHGRPPPPYPDWFGDEEFHLSHRRKLVWKDPEWYCPRFGMEPIDEEPEYFWPPYEEF